MDLWVSRHWQRAYDENGMLAAKGQVDEKLLECMLQHEYFSRPSPKSTGRDLFNEAWLSAQLSGIAALPDSSAALPVCGQEEQRLLDVLATLLALTARSIALHLKQASFSVTQVRTTSRISLPRLQHVFLFFQPPIRELLLYFVLYVATRVSSFLQVVVCGGGVRNASLMQQLQLLCLCPVMFSPHVSLRYFFLKHSVIH